MKYERCVGCGHTVEEPCVSPEDREWCNRYESATLTNGGPDGINPKDAIGQLKIDLSLVSPIAMIHEAHAMMDGAKEYGPFNWRDKRVRARVYVAAALRHILSYCDREDIDPKSGAHHLGHARSCLAIILDAEHLGCLVDDRPPPGAAGNLLRRLNEANLTKETQT